MTKNTTFARLIWRIWEMNEYDTKILANFYADKKCNEFSLAKQYHQNSKLSVDLTEESIIHASPLVMNKVFSKTIRTAGKSYPASNKIYLSEDVGLKNSLYECILNRKSHNDRNEAHKLNLAEISTLCWSAYGIIDKENIRRTVPSAGALYPCEIYLLSPCSELQGGLYHYSSFNNCLEEIKKTDIELQKLFTSIIGLEHASIVFVITSVFDRIFFKYGERAYRFIMIEAGEIVQNISLAASSLGFNATAHGGTADYELENFMEIDGVSESVLIAIGIS